MSWLSVNSPQDESRFAVRQWNLILRNATSVVLVRGTQTLAAQTMSVQPGNEERPVEGQSGAQGSKREVIIFGVEGHPDETVADTDIKRGDQFLYNGRFYKVTDVIKNKGSIQAWTEAVS
jgi:hypothetical protein